MKTIFRWADLAWFATRLTLDVTAGNTRVLLREWFVAPQLMAARRRRRSLTQR